MIRQSLRNAVEQHCPHIAEVGPTTSMMEVIEDSLDAQEFLLLLEDHFDYLFEGDIATDLLQANTLYDVELILQRIEETDGPLVELQ